MCISKLFHKCDHEWVTVDTAETAAYDNYDDRGCDLPAYRTKHYIQECSKCHKMRHYRFKIN